MIYINSILEFHAHCKLYSYKQVYCNKLIYIKVIYRKHLKMNSHILNILKKLFIYIYIKHIIYMSEYDFNLK